MVTYKMKIDCSGPKFLSTDIELVTGDVKAYRFELSFYNNGEKVELSEKTLTVKAKRADGVVISDSGEILGDTGVFIPKNDIFSVPGEVQLEVALTDSAKRYLTTKILILNVIEGMGEAENDAKENISVYVNLLSQISSKLNEANGLLNEIRITERGYSAYEIAVSNGFTGTEEEWLVTLKSDSSVSSENSVQNALSKALTEGSTALGEDTVAGCMGYYYSAIDTTNKWIYLTTTLPYFNDNNELSTFNGYPLDISPLTEGKDKYKDTSVNISDEMADKIIGQKISLVNGQHLDMVATITDVLEGKILVYDEEIDFKTQVPNGDQYVNYASSISYDDYTVKVPEVPEFGAIEVSKNCSSNGLRSKATGIASSSDGRDNNAYGDYGKVWGRNNKAGYCATAHGRNCEASGEYSDARGQDCIVTAPYGSAEGFQCQSHAKGSVAEGNGVIVRERAEFGRGEGLKTIVGSSYQRVGGKFNVEDTNDEFAEIVGGGEQKGSNVTRKNIRTLDWEGNAKYSGKVYAEGDKEVATIEYVDNTKEEIEALIPSTEGLATEEYVSTAIDSIPTTDLTGYATETYVEDKVKEMLGVIENGAY